MFYDFIPPDGQGVSTFWLPSPLLQTVSLVRLHLQADISPHRPYYSCCDPLLFGIKSLYFLNSLGQYSYCPVCSTSMSVFWEENIQLSGKMCSQILFTHLVKNLAPHKTAVCFLSFSSLAHMELLLTTLQAKANPPVPGLSRKGLVLPAGGGYQNTSIRHCSVLNM